MCRSLGRLTIRRVRRSAPAAQVTSSAWVCTRYRPRPGRRGVKPRRKARHSSGRAPSRSWTEAALNHDQPGSGPSRRPRGASRALDPPRPKISGWPWRRRRRPLPDWESMIAAVGCGRRPASTRTCSRSSSYMRRVAPLACQCARSGTRCAKAAGQRHRPPQAPVVGQVADRVDDVAAAVGGRRAIPAQPPARRGQQRLDDRPFRVAHVRGAYPAPGAARPGRAAPARHRAGA